jgi:hypothetical protein
MVILPDGVDACDIGTITIWCEPFTAFFSRLEVPRSVFVSRERERERVKLMPHIFLSISTQVNNGNDPCTLVVSIYMNFLHTLRIILRNYAKFISVHNNNYNICM